jgi:hypothetical protein
MFNDFLKTGKIIHNSLEDEFINHMKTKYSLDVVATDFFVGKIQCRLDMLINLNGRNNEITALLYDAVIKNDLGPSLNKSKRYSRDVVQTAEIIIDEYLSVYHYKREELSEILIHIYDFKHYVKGYIYGNSLIKIREIISPKYLVKQHDIYVHYEPAVTILFNDEKTYRNALKRKEELVHDCYSILKEIDFFGILKENEAEVKLFLKSDLDDRTLNKYQK